MTRLLRTADHVLSAIGITMLVLSLALVPINRSFADDGGAGYSGPFNPTACLGGDGCNNKSACKAVPNTNNCTQTVGACKEGGGCSSCPCTACWVTLNMVLCDCQCKTGSQNGCSSCPPPNSDIKFCSGSGHDKRDCP